MNADRPRVAVIQDGARRHYVVPVALQRAQMLDRMFVEWYGGSGGAEPALTALISPFQPQLARKLRGRFHPELDPTRVIHNPWLVLPQRWSRRRFQSAESHFNWIAKQVGRWILRQGFGNANALYGYIRNVDPAVFRAAQQRGIKTVGDQMIAPGAIEIAQAQIQNQRWPGWEPAAARIDAHVLIDCETQSWAALDHITCGSQYVAAGLQQQGIPAEKITTIPYAPSGADLPFIDRANRTGPMTVGFVGALNLRKGIPYFLETAKRFDLQDVHFVMVGANYLDPSKLAEHRGDVQLPGAVPRSDVLGWLSEFDILLFPSTCEGCAGSVLEAMETGLPVIATPNSGTIIRDGVDGYLRNYDDIDGFETLIRELRANPELRLNIGREARKSVEQLNMDWFTRQLAEMFEKLIDER